jgi:DNA-binding CsgD family transcriptional regulator
MAGQMSNNSHDNNSHDEQITVRRYQVKQTDDFIVREPHDKYGTPGESRRRLTDPAGREAQQLSAVPVARNPDQPDSSWSQRTPPPMMLTALDARILEGVAIGKTTARLAAELHLSHQGVAYHVSAMMQKVKVANRTALTSMAFSSGIFREGCWPPKILPDYIRALTSCPIPFSA